LDYRLNPEHPPVTKALAGLFLTGQPVAFPVDSPAWQLQVNGQWALSHTFLFGSGNNGQRLMSLARRGPILLTLLFMFVVGLWTWRRFGPWWGVAGAAFVGLSPFFLGHGMLVTTDVAAAFGAFVSIITFARYLEHSSWQRALGAGLAFGFAELCKFSLVLLMPAYLVIAIAYAATQGKERPAIWKGVKRFLVVAIIGYLAVVYPVYALFTHNYPAARQVRDTAYVLGSFAGGPTVPGHICKPMRCVAETIISAAHVPYLRAGAEYALGVLMVLQRTVGGSTNYFLGTVSSAGSWWYFPVVYLTKETLPLLILLGIAAVVTIGRWLHGRRGRTHGIFHDTRAWIAKHPAQALMALFVCLYWAASLESSLNIGVRHLFPIIPLMYMLALFAWQRLSHIPRLRTITIAALVALVGWQAGTAFAARPYFLAYFNPLVGGTGQGYRIVTDSNYDWGQDLPALRDWLDTHPDVDKIAVDYFGGGDVLEEVGPRAVQWESADGDPRTHGIHWIAVSVSILQDAIQPLVPGEHRRPVDEYQWLLKVHAKPSGLGAVPPPDARAGTSFLIYYLP
jgi:hypothetical protein